MLITIGILLFARPVSAVSAVNLGTSGDFVVLSKTGITTTGVTSITGDIGTSPIDSTSITGFSLILDPSNQFSTSSLVTGKVYAADYTNPTPTKMTTAISDMATAYTDATGRTLPDYTELYSGDLSGKTLGPGLYKWGTGVLITSDVTLNGNANDVWIFQISQDLTIGSSVKVLLSGGAQARNIFWQVNGGTGVEISTTAHMEGNILAAKAIHLRTGATLNGRALAQTAVTLDANTITAISATPVLTTIELLPQSENLSIGSTQQLNATGFDQFNNSIIAIINYTTSNSSIATVSSSGLVTAIAFGSVIINASSGSVSGISIMNIQANAPILTYIGSKSVTQGNLLSFIITATSQNNLIFTISGKPITANFTDNNNKTATFSWTSNSSDIGTINVNFSVSDGIKSASELVAITINSFQAPYTNQTNSENTWKNIDYNVTLNSTGTNNTLVEYINYTLNNIPGQINGSWGNVLINTSGNNTLTFYAVDSSGNIEQPNTIYVLLDKTSPNITSFILSSTNVNIGDIITGTCVVTDDFSANITGIITGIDTTTSGTKTAICTAIDLASNSATSSVSYIVITPSYVNHGGSGGNYCTTEWNCTEWNLCSNEIQTRTCSYPQNFCTPLTAKPLESQSCITINNALTVNSSSNKENIKTITGAIIGTTKNTFNLQVLLIGLGVLIVGVLGYFIFFRKR